MLQRHSLVHTTIEVPDTRVVADTITQGTVVVVVVVVATELPGSTADNTESAAVRRQSSTAARTGTAVRADTDCHSAPAPDFRGLDLPADTDTGMRDMDTGNQRPGHLWAHSPAHPNCRPVCPSACLTSSLQLYKVLKNNPKTILTVPSKRFYMVDNKYFRFLKIVFNCKITRLRLGLG